MKKLITPILFGCLISLSSYTWVTSVQWKIADGNSIRFTSDDPSGVFKELKGDVVFDVNDLSNSRFDVRVVVNSINTGNGMQNNHAKSSKWLDAKNFPEITFRSERIVKTATGYEAQGQLSIHGVTKVFTMPFTFNETDQGGLFTGSFDVNRNDFEIGKPGGKASEILKVEVSVPVSR